jgi:NADPH-dependent 2,4-dienoyl-CoA reductase/sulfur reductase-like enzyme
VIQKHKIKIKQQKQASLLQKHLMSDKPHVLIVGAGMTGLLLAQKLKSHDISFSIFERDPSADFRGAGWGLAIHWAVDIFLELLPPHLRDQIPQANVDPEALARGERGRFPFFDLVTGERRFENISEKRIRLSSDLDVQVRVISSK